MTATDASPTRRRRRRCAPIARRRRRRGTAARRWWSDTLVFAGRNIEHIRQIPEKLLDVTLQPLMFVLLFAYVFGGAIAVSGGSYREYIIGGILIQSLAFGLIGPATAIATDLTEGVIDRFRSLPASRDPRTCSATTSPSSPGMVAVDRRAARPPGCVVGWRVAHRRRCTSPPRSCCCSLFASAMIWIGTWIGLMVRSPDAVMGVGFVVVFPLTFLSNAFVPIDSLPNVLQWIASWNPISVMVGADARAVRQPGRRRSRKHTWPLEHPVVAAFVYCAVMLAIAVPASLRRYRARTTD